MGEVRFASSYYLDFGLLFLLTVRSFISAKPIDLLAKYISAEEDIDAVEMHEPYIYLNGLSIEDLEDLVEDIKVSGY